MSTEKPEAFSALLDRHSDVAPALSGSTQDIAAYLLSPERAQRFELLMLLISNLGKVLVVSGPDGIGKSTFLGLLKQRAFESWRVVRVAGDGRLRHGDIITQIAEQLAMPTLSENALAEYLEQLGRHKNLLVLLLDDAGKVAPGVLSALWQFASKYPAFRLVLALRPDEAHLKIATDESVLGECHYIDIPALTAPKCKTYLRRLATRPPRLLSVEDITPARTRALYRASHGVPGRIIQLLINAPAARAKARRRRLLAMAAVFVVGMAATLAYFQLRRLGADTEEAEKLAQPGPPSNPPLAKPPPAAESPTTDSRPLPLPPPQLPATPSLPSVASQADIAEQTAKAVGAAAIAAPPSAAAAQSGVQALKEPPPSVVSQVAASAKPETSVAPPAAHTQPLAETGAAPKPTESAGKRLVLTPEGYGPVSGGNKKPQAASGGKAPIIGHTESKNGKARPDIKKDDAAQAGPGDDIKPSAGDSGTPTAVGEPGRTTGDGEGERTSRSIPASPMAEPAASDVVANDKAQRTTGTAAAKAQPSGGAAKPASATNGLAIAGLRDPGWLLAQPPQSYTLRVMVAREPSSIKALLQRYPAMQGQVASFTSRHGAVASHPVYYGVFATEADAKHAAAKLPPALGKPLLRQLKQVQQEARASQH